MKTRQAAYSLIEMLVYISILAVLLGVSYAALYRCMDNSTALRRSSEDIASAIHAGEQWRSDVRAATTSARLETNSTGRTLWLTGPAKSVAYRFAENAVSRRSGNGNWSTVLANVNATSFLATDGHGIAVWRWELELQPRKKRLTNVQPLFTFIAVPAREPQP